MAAVPVGRTGPHGSGPFSDSSWEGAHQLWADKPRGGLGLGGLVRNRGILAVQWLGLLTFNGVQSLGGELRHHMLCGVRVGCAKKKEKEKKEGDILSSSRVFVGKGLHRKPFPRHRG